MHTPLTWITCRAAQESQALGTLQYIQLQLKALALLCSAGGLRSPPELLGSTGATRHGTPAAGGPTLREEKVLQHLQTLNPKP